MRTSRAWSALVAGLLLLAPMAACGGPESGPTVQPTPTATQSAAGSIPALRLGDDGAQVELAVGGTASVMLPATYDWAEPMVDSDAVTVSEDVSDEDSGSRSWTVTARQEGAATVTLTGSPTCRGGGSETPSCEAEDVTWTATFTVR